MGFHIAADKHLVELRALETWLQKMASVRNRDAKEKQAMQMWRQLLTRNGDSPLMKVIMAMRLTACSGTTVAYKQAAAT